MVQMATLFSSSFGGHFSGSLLEAYQYSSDLWQSGVGVYVNTGSALAGYNAFFNSLYSPGIAFNTIKSGIATSNRSYYDLKIMNIILAFVPDLTQPDVNIKQKFETIIEPDVYFSTGTYTTIMDQLYFLKNQSLNTFLSAPESQFATLVSGATYYMDIVVRASSWDFMMYNNKNFNVTDLSSLPYTGTYTKNIPSSYITNSLSYRGISFSNGANQFGLLPNLDPYFENTPCYFYGDSVVRCSFTPNQSRKYTASEIIAGMNYTNFNKDNFAIKNNAISLSSSADYLNDLASELYGTEYFKNAKNTVLDSVKIGITKIPKVTFDQRGNAETVQQSNELSGYDAISIATRYETPIFNFSSSIPVGKAGGIWTSYNENQIAGQGIYLEIQESFPSYRNSSKTVSQTLTGSLIRVLGFDSKNTSKQLGQLADQKLISEAIVAIPIKKDGTRYDLDYSNYNFDEFSLPSLSTFYALKPVDAKPSDSVRKMINTTKKYVMPPHLDFNNNPNVRPFAMYIFEFEHYLDKQDLARIWQNVMPKVAQNHEIVSSEIEHELKPGEILQSIDEEVRWVVFKIKRRAEYNYYSVTADTQDDTRFNYNFTVGNSNTSTKNSDLPYSYNWPYDYFSLIEVGQMDAEVELEKKE